MKALYILVAVAGMCLPTFAVAQVRLQTLRTCLEIEDQSKERLNCYDEINRQSDEFLRQFGQPVERSCRPSKLKTDILTLNITKVSQALAYEFELVGWIRPQYSNNWNLLGLLRMRNQGPSCRRAGNKFDEISPAQAILPMAKDDASFQSLSD